MAALFDIPALQAAIHAVWGGHGAHAEVFSDMRTELSTLRAEREWMAKALEAARIFITPLEMLRNKENWDEYKQDAANRINEALAPRGQEGEG